MTKGKKTVILLTSRRLRAVIASISKGETQIHKELAIDFEPHNFAQLVEAFTKVRTELKSKRLRILLPEEKTYLKLIHFPLAKSLTRELVQTKAQASIPEILKEGYFDWRHAGNTSQYQQVQVLAGSEVYLTFVRRAAAEAKIEIESFEPVSLALARQLAQVEKPVLAVYKTDQFVVAACWHGLVLESFTVEEGEFHAKVDRIKKKVQEVFGLEVNEIVDKNLDPIRGTMIKEDLKGKDAQVLNLPGENMTEETTQEEKAPEVEVKEENIEQISPEGQEGTVMTETPRTEPEVRLKSLEPASGGGKKIIFYVIGGLVLLGLVIGAIWFFTKDKTDESNVVPLPTPIALPTTEPVPEQTPTPEVELERGDLTIQVLNGGGVAGAAGAAEEYLEGLGYDVADTGNAANFDYELTELKVKSESSAYESLLVSDLSEKYELASQIGEVDEDSEYDVVVILGKE